MPHVRFSDPNKGTTPQLGFIAQQVQSIFPDLISTTSASALTPDGTLTLNYIGLIAPIVAAVQHLDQMIADFADHFSTKELTFARAAGDDIVTAHVHTQELCVGSTCVTEDQLKALLDQASQQTTPAPADTAPTDAPSIVPEASTSSAATTQEATSTSP